MDLLIHVNYILYILKQNFTSDGFYFLLNSKQIQFNSILMFTSELMNFYCRRNSKFVGNISYTITRSVKLDTAYFSVWRRKTDVRIVANSTEAKLWRISWKNKIRRIRISVEVLLEVRHPMSECIKNNIRNSKSRRDE